MKISKLADLRGMICQLITESDKNFPKSIMFNRGIEYPKYKITIEEIEEDFFVDAKGHKWIRAKEE